MYLLDTHAIIWYVSGNIELSAKARQLMDSRKCFFSYASLWEIAIKQAKGTLEFNISIPELRNVLENECFAYLPPTEYDAERLKKLPDIHKDPFDRFIIAQAIENDLTIITRDTKIPLYEVKTTW
ncbi:MULTISPECIES: type II toxin-antitoxin system VapC family toxin [Fibrobacter]|uniref:type II toxin-antitoxin system VapC family toxin n=1 Tax=Fibrobacter TaxID=832 RepID=UPI000BB15716|nr:MULTISPECIES: type II toxin-antitoxin system VapC family toxin [Fibrobacter]MDD7298044.1 type II toxin-antitoxin system VapC family toxin [Fibrobacter intestinalis]PBC69298.1 PIN domain nuclease of toxin-antitoxin system [Fibrobacter sp. UWS1]